MVANPAAIAPPTATSLLLKANPALATSLLMKVVPQTAAKALTVKNAAAIKAAAPKRARHAATAQARVTAPLTPAAPRSEEHTSELQSLMRISYAVFCLQKKTTQSKLNTN